MQMYCTFVLFVNQHFPGLPASETHCTSFQGLIVFQLRLYASVEENQGLYIINWQSDHKISRTEV
jgi:hypothetical protein